MSITDSDNLIDFQELFQLHIFSNIIPASTIEIYGIIATFPVIENVKVALRLKYY